VVFITDGQISNEAELFAEIGNNLGQSRLFTIGIGSAPNRYFISRAARLGRGTDLVIHDLAQVEVKMGSFLRALERPAMRDISASLSSGTEAKITPNPIPDLYLGQPLVLLAHITEPVDSLQIKGKLGAGNWSAKLDLAHASTGKGISVLWARSRIRDLEEARFAGHDAETVDQLILQTALDHHLVSRLTSLVAVDVTPSRQPGEVLDTSMIPLSLPDGWGGLSKSIGIVPAAPPAAMARPAPGLTLPATASPFQMQLILGLLLIAFALVFSGKVLPKRMRS
jgi:Ca-activated chloride channel family protein